MGAKLTAVARDSGECHFHTLIFELEAASRIANIAAQFVCSP